jgi:hypothetical protein
MAKVEEEIMSEEKPECKHLRIGKVYETIEGHECLVVKCLDCGKAFSYTVKNLKQEAPPPSKEGLMKIKPLPPKKKVLCSGCLGAKTVYGVTCGLCHGTGYEYR